ncbi:hypothetical protein MKX03_013783, partial [Papaver bracteatum]
ISRLLGWWSIDEGSREEHARLYQCGTADAGFGDYKLLLGSKQKSQNIASGSLRDFKMKKSYAGYAS